MKAFVVGWFLLVAAAVIGWVMNIIQLFGFNEVSTQFIVKLVGVFVAPLGAVLGWIG